VYNWLHREDLMGAHSLTWSPPPSSLTLGLDEVHVWRASLTLSSPVVVELHHSLSEEEHDRAQRYHSPAARHRFLVGRGLLRSILGRYLCVHGHQLGIRQSDHGKPILDAPFAGLHFNVSHSHELALFAVTRRGEVGVDVERVRPFPNDVSVAERFFSPGECQRLQTLAPEHRMEAFFHVWTRKEACLKALGVGLAQGLERVEVNLGPDEPARLLRLDGEERQAARWSLLNLTPAPGYVGALALEGHEPRVVGWHWGED
jgi:4'-phosphopantetheinyl transferase